MRSLCENVHNRVRCLGWIYRCKDCCNVGCSSDSCHVKAFKSRKCLRCGSNSTESVGDYERRMRNEKESTRKKVDKEKRNSRNESVAFGAGAVAGSFMSKRNQKKVDKEMERIQRLTDSMVNPIREKYHNSFQSTGEYLENLEDEEFEDVAPTETDSEIHEREMREREEQKRKDEEYRQRKIENERLDQEQFDMYKGLASIQVNHKYLEERRIWEKKLEKVIQERAQLSKKDFLKLVGTEFEGKKLKRWEVLEAYRKVRPSWLDKLVEIFEDC